MEQRLGNLSLVLSQIWLWRTCSTSLRRTTLWNPTWTSSWTVRISSHTALAQRLAKLRPSKLPKSADLALAQIILLDTKSRKGRFQSQIVAIRMLLLPCPRLARIKTWPNLKMTKLVAARIVIGESLSKPLERIQSRAAIKLEMLRKLNTCLRSQSCREQERSKLKVQLLSLCKTWKNSKLRSLRSQKLKTWISKRITQSAARLSQIMETLNFWT